MKFCVFNLKQFVKSTKAFSVFKNKKKGDKGLRRCHESQLMNDIIRLNEL